MADEHQLPAAEPMPFIPLRGLTVFPYMIIHLDVTRDRSAAAVETAMMRDKKILLLPQIEEDVEEPSFEDLHTVGTVATIRQSFKLPGAAMRLLVEGLYRATVTEFEELEEYDAAQITEHHDPKETTMAIEAMTRAVVHKFEEWVKMSRRIPAEALVKSR